jgi:hypothetical protein
MRTVQIIAGACLLASPFAFIGWLIFRSDGWRMLATVLAVTAGILAAVLLGAVLVIGGTS